VRLRLLEAMPNRDASDQAGGGGMPNTPQGTGGRRHDLRRSRWMTLVGAMSRYW
jgi:hypothetical protein